MALETTQSDTMPADYWHLRQHGRRHNSENTTHMRPASLIQIQRALAVSIALMLVSCSTTRPAAGPMGSHDLAKYAIAFEQQPDGTVTHAWIPLKDFELEKFQHTLSTAQPHRNIVRVSSAGLNAYCDGRYDQCVNDCTKSSRPVVVNGHKYTDTKINPWRIVRGWWCSTYCLEASTECKKGRGEWAAEFDAEFNSIDPAVDWIKRHYTELVVGTVVIIAGVTFVVVIAGTGGAALVLAPALLMTESAPALSSELQLAEVCR